jgi:hypoxanthine phosphoribosyltransferase
MKKIEIDGLLFEPLFEEEQIQKRVRLMGIDISLRYEHKQPVFIGVFERLFYVYGRSAQTDRSSL